jgi:hypothetical protein
MNRRELALLRLELKNNHDRLNRVAGALMDAQQARMALLALKLSGPTLDAIGALTNATKALEAERVWLRDEDTRLITLVAQAERELGVIRTVRLVEPKPPVDLGEVGPLTWVPKGGGPTQVFGPDGWVEVDI